MNYNFAIIGYGKMGQIRHQSIEDLNVGKVIAISEPSLDKEIHDIPNLAHDAIIDHPEVDIVIVCTPNYLNKDLTIRSLEAGKHVFCEKPPCFTAAEMKEIKKVEDNCQNIKLMYGFNHRHHDSIIRMKELVTGGEFGKILWMRGRYGKSVTEDFYNDWRAKKELSGGGILLDQGIHMLDLFLYLGGEFDKVKAEVSNLYWNLDVEDNAFVILKNSKTKMVASMHSTMTQWRHLFSLEVFMEKGYMVLNGLITSSMTYGEETLSIARNRSAAPAATFNDEVITKYMTNNSWRYEMDHFVSAIANKKPVVIGNSDHALELMETIDKIYEERNF